MLNCHLVDFNCHVSVNAEYIEEPATNVKFQTSSSFPGCTDSLTLFGTGFREKVFAIIGVKVYAAGLYLNQSIVTDLKGWKGKSKDVIQGTSSLFNTIFQCNNLVFIFCIIVNSISNL
ncbi:hypothetical protein RYX36_019680 [Vicia faba]